MNEADEYTSKYELGFQAGLMEACKMLREAALEHKEVSVTSKKVLDAQANELANALLSSWANAIEIRCNCALKNAG